MRQSQQSAVMVADKQGAVGVGVETQWATARVNDGADRTVIGIDAEHRSVGDAGDAAGGEETQVMMRPLRSTRSSGPGALSSIRRTGGSGGLLRFCVARGVGCGGVHRRGAIRVMAVSLAGKAGGSLRRGGARPQCSELLGHSWFRRVGPAGAPSIARRGLRYTRSMHV